jgi:hypothetical protein
MLEGIAIACVCAILAFFGVPLPAVILIGVTVAAIMELWERNSSPKYHREREEREWAKKFDG